MGYVRNPFFGSYTLVDKCREGKRQLEAPRHFKIFRPRLVDTQYVCTKIETFKKNTVKSHVEALGLYIQGHKGFWVGLYLGGMKAKKKRFEATT